MSRNEDKEKKEGSEAALKTRQLVSSFMKAAEKGDIATLESLLQQEVNQHKEDEKKELKEQGKTDDSTSNDNDIRRTILRQIKEGNGKTVVHQAALGCQYTVLEWMLEMAPEAVHWRDDHGNTPLVLTVGAGGIDDNHFQKTQKKDNKKSQSGNDSGRPAPLADIVNLLISKGSPVNMSTTSNSETVESENGKKTTKKTAREACSALHHAAGHGDVPVMQLLLNAGADPNALSIEGKTPLHWACGSGQKEAVKTLLARNINGDSPVNVNLKAASDDKPPLMLALARGCDEIGEELVAKGAHFEEELYDGGVTGLHMAAELGLELTVKKILSFEKGKTLATRESSWGKPVFLAATGAYMNVVSELLPHSDLTQQEVDKLLKTASEKKLLIESREKQAREARQEESKSNPTSSSNSEPGTSTKEELKELTTEEKIASLDEETKQKALEYKTKANECFAQKNYSEALSLYSLAIQLNPYDAVYYSNRSAVHIAMENYPLALHDANKCYELKKDWPKACFRMATALIKLEEWEEAAVAAWTGYQMSKSKELEKLLKYAVEKGREEHQANRKSQSKNQEK